MPSVIDPISLERAFRASTSVAAEEEEDEDVRPPLPSKYERLVDQNTQYDHLFHRKTKQKPIYEAFRNHTYAMGMHGVKKRVRHCVMLTEPSWQSMNTGRTHKEGRRYHHLWHCCRRDVTSNPLFRASGIGETLQSAHRDSVPQGI